MIFIVADIAVEESFGLVKASRILKECGVDPKNMHINTFYNTIRVVISETDKIRCISSIRGHVSIEIRSLLRCDSIERTLTGIGFVKTPTIFQRIIGYIPIDESVIVIQKTSKKGVYMARVCRARRIEPPLPPSACTVIVNSDSDLEKVKSLAMYLDQFERKIDALCLAPSSGGVDNQ